MSSDTSRVVIGMDPSNGPSRSVMTADEAILGKGGFATDADGMRELVRFAKRWSDRVWAIEGCQGIGKHVALRLLTAGEDVVDVPPKLSARMRIFATVQGRKTDETDAHSVALVGTRMSGLQPLLKAEQLAILRVLVDRRRTLGGEHTRMIAQLDQLLLELIPGDVSQSDIAREHGVSRQAIKKVIKSPADLSIFCDPDAADRGSAASPSTPRVLPRTLASLSRRDRSCTALQLPHP